MLKNLFTSLLCLHCYALFSQQDTASIPASAPGVSDSSSQIIQEFVCSSSGGMVILNWKMVAGQADYFSIERSSNGKDFEVVAIIKPSSTEVLGSWTDEVPSKGKNTYRLRCTLKNQLVIESSLISASIAGIIPFRFYPNPVDHVFILRSEEPVDIQISDAAGKIRLTVSRLQGLRMINVSSLEKGVYILRVLHLQSNTTQQEQLVKN